MIQSSQSTSASSPSPDGQVDLGKNQTGGPPHASHLLEIQRDLAVRLLSATDLRQCLDLLLSAAMRLTDFDCGGIYLCDDHDGSLNLVAHHGLSDEFVGHVLHYPADSPNTQMVKSGQLVYGYRSEMPENMASILAAEKLEAIAVIPLRNRDQVVASLNVSSHALATIEAPSRVALESLVALGEVAIASVSARKSVEAAEQSLREANEQLEHRVALRTAELESAHAALMEESKRLDLSLAASRAGTWEIQLPGNHIIWDERSKEIFGYPADAEIFLQHFLDRIHPDELGPLQAAMLAFTQPGGPNIWDREIRIIHPIYGTRWVHALGRAERNAKGYATRMVGINMDVTARKRTEESLLASETKYRKLHESMTDAFVCVNLDGRIADCNRSYLEMLGYEFDEIVNLTYIEITPEEWHPMEAELVSNEIMIHGSSVPYQKEYRRKDGSIFPVELRAFLIRDDQGDPSQIWAIVRDISERKRAEQAMLEWNETLEQRVAERTHELKQSEERFRQLAEATFEGIAISCNGIIMDVNKRLEEIHGYNPSEMIGKPVTDFVARESWPKVRHVLSKNLTEPYEAIGLRKDGSTFPEEVRASLRTLNGKTIRITAVRDLTEIKKTEHQLQEQRLELERIQKLALTSEISAGIIHQIAQPLCSMGVNLAAVMQAMRKSGSAWNDTLAILADVEADATRMRDIVMHLRSLINPVAPSCTTVDINVVVNRVLPLLRPAAESRKIEIGVDLDPSLPGINADPVQLSQVLLNLTRNAFDACTDCPAPRRVVEIETGSTPSGMIEIIVRDRGTGIPEHVMSQLFQPFFSTKPDGSGIGLRISRTILQSHGGTLIAKNNTDGPGASFHVILPHPRLKTPPAGQSAGNHNHPSP